MSDALHDWLVETYGSDEEILQAQSQRYAEGLSVFRAAYGAGPISVYRAPGRVNLIGEHTDYNHGYVMPIALDRDTVILARPRADGQVVLRNIEPARYGERRFTLGVQIEAGPRGDWENYIKGPAQALWGRFGPLANGMDALVIGRAPHGVPVGAGLSSSSALTVAAAVALMGVNGLEMPRPELARFCAEAEWYVGTRGGMMDHFISLMGRRGHALFLDCRPDPDAAGVFRSDWAPIPAGYAFLVCDSGKRRQTAHSAYNLRVAECKLGVQLLKRRYPTITHLRDVSTRALGLTPAALDALLKQELPAQADAAGLQRLGISADFLAELLRYHGLNGNEVFAVQARCRHVISENQRVLDSIEALRQGDARRLGALMGQAHRSMSVDYQASCAEVDVLVELLQESAGVLGARITGAGWGGCVVALIEEGADAGLLQRIAPRYRQQTGLEAQAFLCRPAGGASSADALGASMQR